MLGGVAGVSIILHSRDGSRHQRKDGHLTWGEPPIAALWRTRYPEVVKIGNNRLAMPDSMAPIYGASAPRRAERQ